MRSRPDVKLLLSPSVVTPGSRLLAQSVLDAKSETPIDYVAMTLTCRVTSTWADGENRSEYENSLFTREWRSPPATLTPGIHRYQVAFDLPDHLPATYIGKSARIYYALRVHVSIPWWPDRDETFAVPVVWPDSPASPAPTPKSFATSADGPRGVAPFMDLALETTAIAIGEALGGSVSLQNLRGKRIRGVEVAFVETETVSEPRWAQNEGNRLFIRIHDGTPTEAEPLRFRIAVPDSATAAFQSGPVAVATHLEARAIVAWGEDLVVRAPLRVLPRASAPRAELGWVAPVGRERQALAWQTAAERMGLVSDPGAERMTKAHGNVTIEITTRQSDGDFWLVASLGYPSLGLDLDLVQRSWMDLVVPNVVKTGLAEIDARFKIQAREHVQAQIVLVPALTTALATFEEVRVDDASATLARRGSAHSFETLAAFVSSAIEVATQLEAAAALVTAPATFANDIPAWRAFAERHRGRLELGGMRVHDASVGIDRVTVGTDWTRNGQLVGTRVRVPIDPALPAVPASPDDPALSPAARDAWRGLLSLARGVRIEPGAVAIDLEGKLADPGAALPIIELAVALRRALSGITGAGPFR